MILLSTYFTAAIITAGVCLVNSEDILFSRATLALAIHCMSCLELAAVRLNMRNNQALESRVFRRHLDEMCHINEYYNDIVQQCVACSDACGYCLTNSIDCKHCRVVCPDTFAAISTNRPTFKEKSICNFDNSTVSCPYGSVISLHHAVYGRMSLGRCLQQSYGQLGCKADVQQYIESKCAGRESCVITGSDYNLANSQHGCQKDLQSYLEISYKCLPAVDCLETSANCTSPSPIMSEQISTILTVLAIVLGSIVVIIIIIGIRLSCSRRSRKRKLPATANNDTVHQMIQTGHTRTFSSTLEVTVGEDFEDRRDYDDCLGTVTYSVEDANYASIDFHQSTSAAPQIHSEIDSAIVDLREDSTPHYEQLDANTRYESLNRLPQNRHLMSRRETPSTTYNQFQMPPQTFRNMPTSIPIIQM